MNQIILYITIFIAAYVIDLLTALLHRKLKPNNFKISEANIRFRKSVEQYGVWKGIGVYMILSSTESIILFASVWIAAWLIFQANFYYAMTFAFALLSIAHVFGIATNLLALLKEERRLI